MKLSHALLFFLAPMVAVGQSVGTSSPSGGRGASSSTNSPSSGSNLRGGTSSPSEVATPAPVVVAGPEFVLEAAGVGTCRTGYEPLVSSWQACRDAARTFPTDVIGSGATNHVAYFGTTINPRFVGNVPRGCFLSMGSRVHFNNGAGGVTERSAILCQKVEIAVHEYIVVVWPNAVGRFDTLDAAKASLDTYNSGSRLIAEVIEGEVQRDPHTISGQEQDEGNGFSKYWHNWHDINRMIALANDFAEDESA